MNYSLYKIEDFLTDESFVRYCLRENPADVFFWENIQKEQPELSGIIHQAENLFYLLSVKVDPAEKQKELEKLKAFVEAEAPQQKNIYLRWRTTWLSAAAAILICVGIYGIINRKDYATVVPSYQEQGKSLVFKTKFNERKSVKLPDGSMILMNGLTELKVADNYNTHNRVLWLKGEAHFSVAKNQDKPFIVISGKTATTALGTSFKINNYSQEQGASVMLTTGKVSVGTVIDDKVINHLQLLPGEMVNVSEGQEKFAKSTFDLKQVEDWTNRRLVFSRASLDEIATLLKSIYGVEIVPSNKPNKPIAFTGEFSNESLTEVLNAIGFSNHFTYTLKEGKVKLYFNK